MGNVSLLRGWQQHPLDAVAYSMDKDHSAYTPVYQD